ncbi:hypothetical protein BN1708_007881 [Verticillium longisporum]|uniref:Man(5)GlcNAc(2)-PP-dolichol translocation protein RFT1 n=1 Tax=Verticillium longisporum TaxID=100787 RepID=A0A0G4MWI8_VERLO|nr:hypothetical protein BN1708_007881 [Verticillium longisporum]
MPSSEASPSSPADAPGTTTHAPPAAAAAAAAGTESESAAVHGASLLITLQIASRALTFLANQLLLRYLTAALLGLSAQLEVYYLSVLFFARESLRVAIQRQSPSSARSNTPIHQAVVNLGYLAVILGCFVSVGLGALYLSSVEQATLETPYFVLSLRIYGAAAIIELLAEPIFVLMQTRLQFGTRASAESIATFLRCIVTFAAALSASRSGLQLGVLPFALGQLAYGVALLLVYLGAGVRLASTTETGNSFSLLPRTLTTEGSGADYVLSYFYRPTLRLASSMMAQSLVKHVLTQGDTFLVSILSTPQAQGVYALANNYGGLLARLVFQPVEESSRSYFSRLLSAAPTTSSETSAEKAAKASPAADKTRGKPPKEAVTTAAAHLRTLLRLCVLVGALILTAGPAAAPPLLSLVAGPRWARDGAGAALATYCYYIPLLALNGVAEAFVASVATEAQVHAQSAWMGAFSLAFAAAGFVFLRVLGLGARGLVFANCINMACRIVWSLAFVRGYFRDAGVPFSLARLGPANLTAVVVFVAPRLVEMLTGVTAQSAGGIRDVIKVGVAAVPFVLLVLFAERDFLLQCYQAARKRKTE